MITPSRVLNDPALTRALESAHQSEEAYRQTRLAPSTLARLVAAGLVYITNIEARGGRPARCYVHLTARGCMALGVETGIRR